jgi:hypothetical protein
VVRGRGEGGGGGGGGGLTKVRLSGINKASLIPNCDTQLSKDVTKGIGGEYTRKCI